MRVSVSRALPSSPQAARILARASSVIGSGESARGGNEQQRLQTNGMAGREGLRDFAPHRVSDERVAVQAQC